MRRAACASCFRYKKKCDLERPCGRCRLGGRECIERETQVTSRPKGIRYTTHACSACNQSKVRCGSNRPCRRCLRLGYECSDFNYKYKRSSAMQTLSIAHSNALSPYHHGFQRPFLDLENISDILIHFLTTISPFVLTEVLTGQELFFKSCMTCVTSVLPAHRRREFLTRMLELAYFDGNAPYITHLTYDRIEQYLNAGQVSIPRINGAFLDEEFGSGPQYIAIDSSLDDQAIIEYYLYQHTYKSFPECTHGSRPGVLVHLFLDPDRVDGSNLLLFGALNPEAEIYTGYTSDEFNALQNVISSGFTLFDGVPEVLRIYHVDDVHSVMTNGLISYLSPGIEVAFKARLIHRSGRFVYAKCAHLTLTKPNGQIKAVVTTILPLPSIEPT